MKKEVSLVYWVEMWDSTTEDVSLKAIHEELFGMYSEPHRHYHNLSHIEACLKEFNEAKHLLSHPFEVWLGIWFHDSIYIPREKDNEEASRDFASQVLRGFLGEESLELVFRFILATKHDHPAYTRDEKLIMDIDLAILGKDVQTFDEYEKGVRMEYQWVPEDNFRKGRMGILMGFLDRNSIYQTDYFREIYEDKARQNLRHSISELKKGD